AETVEQLQALMARMPVPLTAFVGNLFAGMVGYHTGALDVAHRAFDAARAASDAPMPDLVVDLHTHLLSYRSLVLLHRGHPDRARECSREAHARGESLGSPFFRGNGAQVACFLQAYLRDMDGLARASDEAIALGEE